MVATDVQYELLGEEDVLPADQYDDQQYQNPAPIGPQDPIPEGVHDCELSWDRKKGWMRLIIDGRSWWFKEFVGRCQVVSTNNEKGRLNIRASARIDGDILRMWRDPDAKPHPRVDGVLRRKTQNRLCYRRVQRDFRVNDDGTARNGFADRTPDTNSTPIKERKLVYVQSYVGELAILWNRLDSVAHIYHMGETIIDDNNVAHLYDPLVT